MFTYINFVLNTLFCFRKIILQKKCQNSLTNSDLRLPPSRNDKNTIIYINNIPIQDVNDVKNVKSESDSDVVMINNNMNIDRDIIVISDDNDSLIEITTASDVKVKGMETDCDSKDMLIDLSNETMCSLNVLDNSDLDKYMTELEDLLYTEMQDNSPEILIGGNRANNNEFKKEVNNNDKNNLHLTLSSNKNSFDNYSKSSYEKNDLNLTFSKDIYDIDFKNYVENNLDVNAELKHEKKDVAPQNDIQNDFDTNSKLTGVSKHFGVISPCSGVSKDFDISPSLCSSKRTRSDSENSDIITKKYKRSNIKRVSVVPENSDDKITIDLASKVQTLISAAIDKASFLPLLQCHGIKNNTLVYTCHSEKTYVWLKKVIDDASDLKMKTIDVEFDDEDYYKLKLKINSFIEESLNIFLNRIELYNAGLVTDKWKLINRQIFRDFIVMTLWVDRDSFQYISQNNFSLFAGVDKIQFCICF